MSELKQPVMLVSHERACSLASRMCAHVDVCVHLHAPAHCCTNKRLCACVCRPGQMQKAFEDGTMALKVGELSGPIQSDSGTHLILRTG